MSANYSDPGAVASGEDYFADALVIGTGAGGAACALEAARAGLRVALLTRSSDPRDSTTFKAQGGIVTRPAGDSAEALRADILGAGDGLCDPRAAALLAEQAPAVVGDFLMRDLGVEFSREEGGELDYTQEAAHSCRRILHADDATGEAIGRRLLEAVSREPRIRLLTDSTAVDLMTVPHHSTNPLALYDRIECLGAYVLSRKTGLVGRILAPKTVLATGGVGEVFLHTTNPRAARGDGLAMASRAGATVINAEYVQFHPTAFYHRDADRFLISEAARGEGARVMTKRGRRFLEEYHPDGELAPRDVVARAIHEEMLKSGDEYVLLDLRGLEIDPKQRFPTIYRTCLEYGVDISSQPIPVVPAAHYFCGGVKVDLLGRTDIANLYAVGEVSCTGVHGANRLASTSLLEALLWGKRAGQDIAAGQSELDQEKVGDLACWHDAGLVEESDPLLIIQDWMTIKSTMWNYAGIVRTRKRLARAIADLNYLNHRVEQFYRETRLGDQLIGLRNGLETARLIAQAAWRNPTSRGCHYRAD